MERTALKVIAAMLLSAALVPAPAGAQATIPLEQSRDGHLNPSFRGWADHVYIPPRTRYVQPRRVYVFNDAITKFASEDKTLSRLCQRGAFLQEIDGIYWAETPERRYGVAFSGGANLIDPQKRRLPGRTYFFEGQASRCRVFVAEQVRVMDRFTAPGTTVPMAGPTGIPYLPKAGAADSASGQAASSAAGGAVSSAQGSSAQGSSNATGGASYGR